MCHQHSTDQLSPDEERAAEESFALYCKPVKLYNILQQRSIENPLFMQRNLLYKIHARRKKRIQITISLSGSTNTKLVAQNIFPLYVLLARSTCDISLEGHTPIYQFSRAFVITSFSEFGNKDNSEATFTIPDVNNFSTSDDCNLNIILISCGQVEQIIGDGNCSQNDVTGSSLQKLEGKCSWGKIPTDLLASSLVNCVNLSLGDTVDLFSTVTMSSSFLEPKFLEQESCLTFCSHKVDATSPFQLQLCISAQEAGARDMSQCPYSSYSYDDVPLSSLQDTVRLRDGNVLFNYKYYNNMMKKTEVTEDFSCPFCLVRCGSFKGLRCHLNSSHDLFRFEFLITEEYGAVNVSLKADAWKPELVAEGVDPIHQTFSYRSRFKKQRQLVITTEKARHVHSHIMEPGSPKDAHVGSEDDCVQKENGLSVSHAPVDPANSAQDSNLPLPTVLRFGKTRKLYDEPADPINQQRLQIRQFFHSQTSQPMALEEVYSDRDSEDEVDNDIADAVDKRMLDDFLDVSKDEKQIMHMWNSFVRRQRVFADGHVPWACKAFSRMHGQQLVENTGLLWVWRFFMIKLWNHNLLDGRTMDTCNRILEGFKNGSSGPK